MSNRRRRAAGTGALFKWMKRSPTSGQLEQVGWCAIADLGIVEGKRVRKTKYGPGQKELAK